MACIDWILMWITYMSRELLHVEHNVENKIKDGYHMSEINYFKALLLCKM
jgi:hypothetical protein